MCDPHEEKPTILESIYDAAREIFRRGRKAAGTACTLVGPLAGTIGVGGAVWMATHGIGVTALATGVAAAGAALYYDRAYLQDPRSSGFAVKSKLTLCLISIVLAMPSGLFGAMMAVDSFISPLEGILRSQARNAVRNEILRDKKEASTTALKRDPFSGREKAVSVSAEKIGQNDDGGAVLIRYNDGTREINLLVEHPDRTRSWERIPVPFQAAPKP